MLLQRLSRLATLLLVFFLACLLQRIEAGKKGRKKDDDNGTKKVAMAHHSFAVPLAFDEFLKDWTVSGASLVERDRLLIHPSVPQRAGFVWSKEPLLTNDFEITMAFRVVGPKGNQKSVQDQSFSLWYVYENVSASYNETSAIKAESWKQGLEEQGMTLGGMKAKFHGLGAVLSMSDSAKKSVVSGIWNDGSRSLTYGSDVPTSTAKAVDFRNTMNAAQFKLRVTPKSIEGHLKLSPSLSWNECFKIDRSTDPVKPGGYIGISAWSGAASPDTVSDLVSITQFDVGNYDTSVLGEENKDVSADIQNAFREMLTDENRHFVDQKSQSDHLNRLTQMLVQHVETSKPTDEKMFEELSGLNLKVGKLDEDCKTLTKELQILVAPKGETSPMSHAGLKDDIIGLRRLLVKDGMSHTQRLDDVQKKMTEVKKIHSDASRPEMFAEVVGHSERLHSTVKTSTSQTSWMLLAIVFVIVVIGGLMWNRMVYYERKHFF